MNFQDPNGFGAPPQGHANPYHAPQYGFQRAGPQHFDGAEGPGGSGGMTLKWWVIASGVSSVVLLVVAGILAAAMNQSEAAVAALVPVLLGCLASIASLVLYHCWIFKSWELIPPNQRYTEGGTRVTPSTAVGYLFIPFYGLYWRFVAHAGLCDALNRVLTAKGSHKRAPNGLAIATCVVWMIPYLNILVGPWLAIAYLIMIDGAKAEYLQISNSAASFEIGRAHV